ncbi:uncharacterized protein (TIGR04222 family) [Stackebrandtia albiflava]|uniref:Uncharacterized protein (TIGR04222 family) n=1 Tax=Stackebrandtia albiflava TaxID=406432 RepID=A0A562V9X5_9ACTN|nr:TIGR04222 domain-containing membrane protein [Stackebrandtia albiflava]TWJ14686.1 uncharacterized protein (TIGR04222 family) [Stackebrandtia albiflava]
MDWTAPHVVVAVVFSAATQAWFVVMMILTGRAHRRAVRDFPATEPDLASPDLSHEELGMLAEGDRRLVEVALARLWLEGHVRVGGWVSLVDEPTDTAKEGSAQSARRAVLDRLRDRRGMHLPDIVHAARRRTDFSDAQRRLISAGLVNEVAERVTLTRRRVTGVYTALMSVAIMGVAGSMGVASVGARSAGEKAQVTGVIVGLFLFYVVVTAVTRNRTGGRLHATTPAGRELLAATARVSPEPKHDRVLHRVALHGLSTVPEFAEAAQRVDPSAGQSTGQRTFSVFASVFAAIAGIFGPGDGTRR